MANTTLQIKHSTVAGNTPSSLANGEIAINSRDGVLYYSTPSGTVTTLSAASGPAGLNKEIQFNDSGSLGGNNKLTFDKTTGELVVNGTVRANIFSDDGVDLYDFSNRAFSAANAAFSTANSAFANNVVQVSVFETTSNGEVASYNIGYNPVSKEAVMVTIAGIVQPVSSYSVNTSANTITFSENPQNGELVRVASFYTAASPTYLQLIPANVTPSIFETTANGSASSFALGFNPGDTTSVLVSIAGIVQPSDAYSVDTTSNTITFIGEAPANGEKVRVVSFYSAANVFIVNNNSVTFEKLETTVNTKISLSLNQANAAFNQSNAAFNTAAAAFDSANNSDGINLTQNTDITVALYNANSAWDTANAAFATANAGSGQVDAYNKANAAFDKANTAFINAAGLDGINNTQNNSIAASFVHANAAFNVANTAVNSTTDITARNTANAAFSTANSKTFTFEQNTSPSTANSSDFWINIDTGFMYQNFGNSANPVWAEVGPTGTLSNTSPGAISATTITASNTVNVTYTPSTTIGAALNISAANTQGGTGYSDFLKVTNTSGGATNPDKTFRLNSVGGVEVINSAYTATLMSLSDTGSMSIALPYQVAGKQAVNGPAFSAYANATLQTITSGSQQKVLFQTEEFDTNNNYASSRFTPTVEGYYQLNAEVRLDGASGTGEMMIVIYKNGTEYKRGINQSGTQIASGFWAMQVSSIVYANGTTDYFEIYVQQSSGASVTVTAVNNTAITWFNGCMLRGA
jgi:hypothetical protein